jgi:hypothetical protein
MSRLLAKKYLLSGVALFGTLASWSVQAEEPGQGLTARFEVWYLKLIADHHLSALRMTEVAAGTDADDRSQLAARPTK